MTLNTAVVAPMPSARERTAASANPGLFLRFRAPYRTSCQRIGIGETQYITTVARRQGAPKTRKEARARARKTGLTWRSFRFLQSLLFGMRLTQGKGFDQVFGLIAVDRLQRENQPGSRENDPLSKVI